MDAAKHSMALQHQLTKLRLTAHLRLTSLVAVRPMGMEDVGPVHTSRLITSRALQCESGSNTAQNLTGLEAVHVLYIG